jgi:hypothetical protein
MKINTKKKCFFNLIFVLFILFFSLFNPNNIFAMRNEDIASSSRRTNRTKILKLSSSSTSITNLRNLGHKLPDPQYDILKSLKLNLSSNQHLLVDSLVELKNKFSEISIDFFISFEFFGAFPDSEGSLSFVTLKKQESESFSIAMPLQIFEELIEPEKDEYKLKLKENEVKKTIFTYFYDTQCCNKIVPEHFRWNADNLFEVILDIEITQKSEPDIVEMILIFKTYSYTSENLFFNIGFCVQKIFFS